MDISSDLDQHIGIKDGLYTDQKNKTTDVTSIQNSLEPAFYGELNKKKEKKKKIGSLGVNNKKPLKKEQITPLTLKPLAN